MEAGPHDAVDKSLNCPWMILLNSIAIGRYLFKIDRQILFIGWKSEAIKSMYWVILNVLQNEIILMALTLRRLLNLLLKHLIQLVNILIRLNEVRLWHSQLFFLHQLTKLMLVIQLFHHVKRCVKNFHSLSLQIRTNPRIKLFSRWCTCRNEYLSPVIDANLLKLIHISLWIVLGI